MAGILPDCWRYLCAVTLCCDLPYPSVLLLARAAGQGSHAEMEDDGDMAGSGVDPIAEQFET